MEDNKTNGRDEIYSAKVKAGKRTYFFDVKATRSIHERVEAAEESEATKATGVDTELKWE